MKNLESFKLEVLNKSNMSNIVISKFSKIIDSELNRIYKDSINNDYKVCIDEVALSIGFVIREKIQKRQESLMGKGGLI